MVQNAVVKKVIREGVVEVSLLRQMECGLHCDGACEACGQKPKEEILALATDKIGVGPGSVVEVEPAVGHNLSAPVIVFLLPCIGLVLGYLVGQKVMGLGEVAAVGAAFGGLAVGFLPAFAFNRVISRSTAPQFNILKRLV